MVTKVSNRCYRFVGVDFEPENRALYWSDRSVTSLTYEECKLLELLCHHAGEVLSSRVLYIASTLPDTTFTQHQNNLCSLLAKAYKTGKKKLPIAVVGDFGYRIDLPKRTYQKDHSPLQNQVQSKDTTNEKHCIADKQSEHNKFSLQQKCMMGIISLLCVTLIFMFIYT